MSNLVNISLLRLSLAVTATDWLLVLSLSFLESLEVSLILLGFISGVFIDGLRTLAPIANLEDYPVRDVCVVDFK